MSKIYYIDDHERTCPQCKKLFIVPSHTVYKERIGKNVVPFCSWTCLCAYRRERGERTSKCCIAVVKKSRWGNVTQEYPSKAAACRENNISAVFLEARLDTGEYDKVNDCYWRYKHEREETK